MLSNIYRDFTDFDIFRFTKNKTLSYKNKAFLHEIKKLLYIKGSKGSNT